MGAGLVYPYTPPDGSVPGYRAGLHKRKTLANNGTKSVALSAQDVLEISVDISPFFRKTGDVLLIHSCSAELQPGDFTGNLSISQLAVAIRDKATNQNLAWFPTFLLNFFGTFALSKVPGVGVYYQFNIPVLRWDDFTEFDLGGIKTPLGMSGTKLVLQAAASNADGGAAHSFSGTFVVLIDTQNLNLTGGVRSGI